MEFDARVIEEVKRLNELLVDLEIKPKKLQVLGPIIENVAWMKVKLDDAREAVKTSNIAISYDNGGGQRGLRENPLFKGYEALWKSYMAGMTKILDSLPAEAAVEVKQTIQEENKTVLELVRAKHRKDA